MSGELIKVRGGGILSTECDLHFITGGPECVVHHEEFALLCLQPAVLRNVLVCMNDTRADNWDIQQNRSHKNYFLHV